MNSDEARVEAMRILDTSLDELTEGGRSSVLPQVRRSDWDLREEDRAALWSYGLPPPRDDGLLGIVASFQEGAQPELEHDGAGWYRIGTSGTARLAARAGSGLVLAISKYTEVHPQLRQLHPAGITPTVVNSTVANLVDAAWRWHWLLPLLAQQQIDAGNAEVAAMRAEPDPQVRRELPNFYAPYQDLCTDVLARFQARDPIIGPEAGFWPDTIIDVW